MADECVTSVNSVIVSRDWTQGWVFLGLFSYSMYTTTCLLVYKQCLINEKISRFLSEAAQICWMCFSVPAGLEGL